MTDSASGSAKASKVKICGIKEETTLHGMSGLSVQYIGFMFAKSRRQVSLERAAELLKVAKSVPMADGQTPLVVGVFVDPSMEQLAETLAVVPLDIIQLHGNETPDFCREVAQRFAIDVWRALPADDDAADQAAGAGRLDAYKGAVSTLLLDTAGGGTGKTFRWDVIPSYQEAAERNGLQLFVAGGLSPDNVVELITTYHPVGVDISSGVETDGMKDLNKITAFVERVKSS